jgi:hypothetical protein
MAGRPPEDKRARSVRFPAPRLRRSVSRRAAAVDVGNLARHEVRVFEMEDRSHDVGNFSVAIEWSERLVTPVRGVAFS